MTLPATGAIAMSQTNTERGAAAASNIYFSWLSANSKSPPSPFHLNWMHSKAWYAIAPFGINVAVPDSRPWFQDNCNCNCDCNCDCTCGAAP